MRILDRTPSFFFGHLLGQPLEFPVAGWPSEASIFIHSDQAVGFSVGVSTGAGVVQEGFQVARGVTASCCHPTRHCCGGVGDGGVPHVPLHRTVSVTRPHDVSRLDCPFHPTVDGEKDPDRPDRYQVEQEKKGQAPSDEGRPEGDTVPSLAQAETKTTENLAWSEEETVDMGRGGIGGGNPILCGIRKESLGTGGKARIIPRRGCGDSTDSL